MAQLVPPINLAQFGLEPSPPFFATAFTDELGQIGDEHTALGKIQDPAKNLDVNAVQKSLDGPINAASTALDNETRDTTDRDLGKLQDKGTEADKHIKDANDAIGGVNKKAGDLKISVPTIDGTKAGTGPPTPPPAPVLPPIGDPKGPGAHEPGTHLQFTNLTRPGSPGRLKVGEHWSLKIYAPVGARIDGTSRHNGKDLPQVWLGVVPAGGVYEFKGIMAESDKGLWIEYWYEDGKYVGTVGFTVE